MYDKFYFIDFDGTITKQDSLDLLFEKFASKEWRDYDKMWENGEIGSLKNLTFAFSTFDITKNKLDFIVDLIEVDTSLYDFLIWLNKNNYGYMIISEGIDYIIKNVLLKNAPKDFNLDLLNNLNISSNKFSRNTIIFANKKSNDCNCISDCNICSNCKYNITKNIQAKEKIYIGDGLSDRFGILNCDLIYAKKKLSKYCIENNIEFKKQINFDSLM